MANNNFPIDNGNATIVSKETALKTNIVMKRFENIFDDLSEEPISMKVKEEEKDHTEDEYICILRVRIWNRKKECCSWNIYSRDRQKLDNVIIRKVIWDMEKDMAFARENIRENRKLVLLSNPSITIHNKYISDPDSNYLIQMIENLDKEIENGFVLCDNGNPTWEWRDLEILRLYDWGQIHYTWSPDKKNEKVEKKIKDLISGLDVSIEKEYKNIFSLTLNYEAMI